MDWTTLLNAEVEEAYRAADKLMERVDDGSLGWKPETGQNWMTVGQLLHHMTSACGATSKGFVTGDWGMPEGASAEDMPPEEMLPPADAMPTASSVAEARQQLAEDKKLAKEMIERAAGRFDEMVQAPWDPAPRPLGQHLLGMIVHLANHKSQLFYYLKLMGQPVNTMHFYGMA